MHWIDWLIVLVPILIVAFIGFKTQKYVKSVSDFLTAGRVAGRYVVSVASAEAAFGLISLVAMFEAYYNSGKAYYFWMGLGTPIYMMMALTGFCFYRYRETRAMTMGQFLEIRYSRKFRIFGAVLQSISGIINYGLFPAVGARFLVYYCDLPLEISIGGWVFPTFALVMAIFLLVAVVVATFGGQITIMVTDCVQGILSYPLYAIIVGYLIYKYSWFNDVAPALLDRPPGKSMVNPFDTAKLRDFNLFYILVGIFGHVINRMSWAGNQGYNAAALNAHEQKMGAVLGSWRTGFSSLMYVLLAMVAFMFLTNAKFSDGDRGALACRNALAIKAFNDVANESKFDTVRKEYKEYLLTGKISPALQIRIDEFNKHDIEKTAVITKLSQNEQKKTEQEQTQVAEKTVDKESMLTVGQSALKSVSKEHAVTFKTIFGQMRVPMALKYILPIGITGAFCALCVFLLISTDTTSLHSWGSIIVQDLILPIRGKPFTPRQQLLLLRVMITGVAVFVFFFSYFFGQVDYILMFFAITGAIWLGGAGACIVGGLYWKRGTSAGAWTALICGSSLAIFGALGQKLWASIYPWICENGLLASVTWLIEGVSAPLEPFIQWRVNPDKFPINSQEMYAISMFVSISLYIIISLLTCRKPFNMEKMLHRGKYKLEGKIVEKQKLTVKNVLLKFLGINEEYTRGDKILAWSVFIWSFGLGFLISFVMVLIWNNISPWSNETWIKLSFFQIFILGVVIATISTVWFTIGGTWDLRRLFRRLKEKETNILDDGRVIGHVSADDVALVEEIEHINISEAHREEDFLENALEEEHDDVDIENLHKHQKKHDKDK